MATVPEPIQTAFELRAFEPRFAAVVAGWVPSDDDLFWLAPGTAPPLTSDKVSGWTTHRDNPLLLCQTEDRSVVGYAELNPLPRQPADLWIGHLIVDPSRRGQGLGQVLTRRLLQAAFARWGARRVCLVVFPENAAAVQCYLRCGMVRDGIQIKSFAHRPGRHRMVRMQITQRQYERQCAGCGPC